MWEIVRNVIPSYGLKLVKVGLRGNQKVKRLAESGFVSKKRIYIILAYYISVACRSG
jgi:hypothetical protein